MSRVISVPCVLDLNFFSSSSESHSQRKGGGVRSNAIELS
jgi:hypothetical protein